MQTYELTRLLTTVIEQYQDLYTNLPTFSMPPLGRIRLAHLDWFLCLAHVTSAYSHPCTFSSLPPIHNSVQSFEEAITQYLKTGWVTKYQWSHMPLAMLNLSSDKTLCVVVGNVS